MNFISGRNSCAFCRETACSPTANNILCYFVHQRLLVPFGLGVLLSCMFVCLCHTAYCLIVYTDSAKQMNELINE